MDEVCEGKDYSFPKEEERVLELWDKLDAFQTQLKLTEGKPEYIFYDGPPFATGLPHYGHILAGTIKDIVTRYQTANGFHVTRRFGWDCHGLPVEYEIDQKLNIKTKEDVLRMGIDVYNEECRSIVMRYAKEWETVVKRVGRWIDFEKDYKTLDCSFMESVWWVFKQLHDKGLVYRGFKVMPYSTGCNTALSNFEAGLNYKEVSDPAVMVTFPLIESDEASENSNPPSLVAWTTTPWTLPSNLALCVNANLDYVKLRNRETGAILIVERTRASSLPSKQKQKKSKTQENPDQPSPAAASTGVENSEKAKGEKKEKKSSAKEKKGKGGDKETKGEGEQEREEKPIDEDTYEILGEMKGKDLVGKRYVPLFDYFKNDFAHVAFRVVADDYVTNDSGTGVVHLAPAFGEDDYRVCTAAGIVKKGEEVPNPVDGSGRFLEIVTDFQGRYVKEADKDILAKLKSLGRLLNSGSIMHSYPFCWRSDTPLIYRAVPSWFVAVEKIKDRLLANNEKSYWIPDYVKEKRFANWLENARDWAVSRSRFWGTPLPIWLSEDGKEMKVVGSIKELEELSGEKEVTDLHRHKIDHIEIPSERGKEFGQLRRVEEVFDCWFESGSMPYAYIHYPFENREMFETNFPGDFVAEGLDQTRGWFYTLMVLSTALFDKPAFKNLICNGLVLAEDGKKMSKRLKNYPPPMEVVNDYGADALRLYLINSPVVRAEPLRFKKEGVFAMVRDVFLPWFNAYRFLVQNSLRLEMEGQPAFIPLDESEIATSSNVLDVWINSATMSLTLFVKREMEAYRLYTVVPFLLKFIDSLTNVYVRFNRRRLKGKTGTQDCCMALSTLFHVLLTLCKVMCPFTPFFTESMFQNLRKALPQIPPPPESIHFTCFPEPKQKVDVRIEQSVSRMMTVIDLARNIRERHNKPIKMPLKEMVVVHSDPEFLEDITGLLRQYVEEELNIRKIISCNEPLKYAVLKAEPEFSLLGKRLGKSMGAVTRAVKAFSLSQVEALQREGLIEVEGHVLKEEEIKIVREFKPPEGVKPSDVDAAGDGDVLVVLDLRPDEDLVDAGCAREIVNRVQKLRKKAGLEPTDLVEVFYEPKRATAQDDEAESDKSIAELARIVQSQSSFIKEALGCSLLPISLCPADAVRLAEESFSGVSALSLSFSLLIARQSLVFEGKAILELCGGNEEHAEAIQVVLRAKEFSKIRNGLSSNGNQIVVSVEGQGTYTLFLGSHFHLSVSDSLEA